VLKNSAPVPSGKERSVTRLCRTGRTLRSSVGWSVDTPKNEPKLLPSGFFNTIGQKQTYTRHEEMTKFPFNDLHGFKDYVVFVKMCAPNQFPLREGGTQQEQWTLELAFRGLREGLSQAFKEKGQRKEFEDFSVLVDQAYNHYQAGRRRDGFICLDQAQKVLRRIPTR
jgi:hypothetical protein